MSTRFALSRRARWAVPVVAVAAVAAAVGVPMVSADASPALPTRTAAQLLASLDQAPARPFSGTVVETARLGLPELPTTGTSTNAESLLTGSHTLRVWSGGQQQLRLALVGTLAESDLIRNGANAWVWDSQDRTAVHYVLPSKPATPTPSTLPSLTPDQAAQKALAAVDPTTAVSVDGTARVAGRSAYQLILSPKSADSLISSVRLAVDAKTFLPLRVQVFATGHAAPAFETGFTSVTFSAPGASLFRFTAPPGTKVTTKDLTAGEHPKPGQAMKPSDEPTVIGTSWTSVLQIKNVNLSELTGAVSGAVHGGAATSGSGSSISSGSGSAAGPAAGGAGESSEVAGALLKGLKPVSGSFGHGRLLTTSLVSVLVLDDGTAYVGAVTPQALERVAAQQVKG